MESSRIYTNTYDNIMAMQSFPDSDQFLNHKNNYYDNLAFQHYLKKEKKKVSARVGLQNVDLSCFSKMGFF